MSLSVSNLIPSASVEKPNFFAVDCQMTHASVSRLINNFFPNSNSLKYREIVHNNRLDVGILGNLLNVFIEDPFNFSKITYFIERLSLNAQNIDVLYPLDSSGKVDLSQKIRQCDPDLIKELNKVFPSKQFFLSIYKISTVYKTQQIARKLIITRKPAEFRPLLQIGSYTEITKRLNDKEGSLTHLEKFCENRRDILIPIIRSLQEAIENPDLAYLEHLINTSDRKMLFVAAFLGFKEGNVHSEILFRLAEILTLRDKPVQIFDILHSDPHKAGEAQKLIRNSTSDYLNSVQRASLYDLIKTWPKEQRLIFTFHSEQKFIPCSEISDDINYRRYSIGELIVNKLCLNPLNLFREQSGYKQLIVSNCYFEYIFEKLCPENSLKINPVFGLSSVDDIRTNGLQKSRDLAFPWVKISADKKELEIINPETADTYRIVDNDFQVHDRYHAIVAACIPKENQDLYIQISDFITQFIENNKSWIDEENIGVLDRIRCLFLDMDFPSALRKKLSQLNPEKKEFQIGELINTPPELNKHTVLFLDSLAILFGQLIYAQIDKIQLTFLDLKKDMIDFKFSKETQIIYDNKYKMFELVTPFKYPHMMFEFINLLINEALSEYPHIKHVKRHVQIFIREKVKSEIEFKIQKILVKLMMKEGSGMEITPILQMECKIMRSHIEVLNYVLELCKEFTL